ncbi:hypothetical protein [Candidatus Villigracilis affinis]|uniref:hypothetical protein n=1 Tax=Candidatus Villigracilis affinis TaxID=3140682 RepID=UPI002A1C5C71|nr:hypothetical protein [Anaerolineales bacterium]
MAEKEATANTPNFYTELIFWQRLNQNLPERKITKSDNRPRTKTEATKQSQSKPMQTETQAKNLESPDGLETQTAEGELKFAGHSDDDEASATHGNLAAGSSTSYAAQLRTSERDNVTMELHTPRSLRGVRGKQRRTKLM